MLSAYFLPILIFGSQAPQSAVKITIDPRRDVFPISPAIYGMNDNGIGSENGDVDPKLAKLIRLPSARWGGDAATRYNWKIDRTNSGGDWYFMAGSGAPPSRPSQSADAFVRREKALGGIVDLTIPIIPYIDSSVGWNCSFPVSIFGAQQSVNPYVHPVIDGKQTNAGNGMTPQGKPIILTTAQILRDNRPNSPQFEASWVKFLVNKFGNAAHGGVQIYQLDNEPSGWSNTHRDVHPNPPTYQEIIPLSMEYAKAIKKADPTASILGPSDFGIAVYRGSPEKQGGLWNVDLYLNAFRNASEKAHKRLLNYYDEHYYPVQPDGLQPQNKDAWRIECTRSLWDPTYKENNWIGKYIGPIDLLPSMNKWVAKDYPGTKISLTEYSFGGYGKMSGAIAEADALGLFGDYHVSLATLWGPPKLGSPVADVFRMFRNADGAGHGFLPEHVFAQSSLPLSVSCYASRDSSGKFLTLVLINKTNNIEHCHLSLPVDLHYQLVSRYEIANSQWITPSIEGKNPMTGARIAPMSVTLLKFIRK